MAENANELVGWPVVHQYFRIDRARWRGLPASERAAAVEEFAGVLRQAGGEEGLQFVPQAPLAKADFAYMAVHPDLRRLQQLGQQLAATAFGTCLLPVYAFLSMSEVSEYMSTAEDWRRELIEHQHLDPNSPEFAKRFAAYAERMAHYAEARVHPQLPGADMSLVCFYPMSKSRGETRNWYALPFEERKRLMAGHGTTGRKFAGRVLQLITSSTGLDDWEWGVTLFARDLKSLRDVVYEMRFDEGSALYGLFGEFHVGIRIQPDELRTALQL
ncbi:MAG: chlorite dismutase family protein [Deltaproteobacteria bacterium]|nr:chlorite dismutase family protein [Deltaproteobacteria bacterium]